MELLVPEMAKIPVVTVGTCSSNWGATNMTEISEREREREIDETA